MMLRIALRRHLTGLFGCSALGLVVGLIQSFGFAKIAGSTAAEKLQFGHQMELFGRQISYLLPLPIRPETMAGYVEWRVFGFMPPVVAVWALFSATGAIRGEEEHGLLETWLSTGLSRSRLIATRMASFTIVAGIAIAATALACALGAAVSGSPLGAGRLLGESAALLALAVACLGLSLVAAQLVTTRRAAAGWGGATLLVLFLLNSLNRTAEHPGPSRWLSPFSYYDQSRALAPGGHFDLAATAVLLAAALALTVLAAGAFVRRDLGAALFQRRAASSEAVHRPARNPMLRLPVLAAVYEQRIGLAAWLVGTGLMAIFFVSLAKQTADLMQKIPSLRGYLSALAGGNVEQAFIGFFWFGILQLILAAYAITQVSHWSSEDTEGRLEMMLSEPIHRWRVVVERAATLALVTSLIIVVGVLVTMAAAPGSHITLDAGDVLRASFPLLPFGLTFGACGAALAGQAPRVAVTLLSAYAVASYLLSQLGPLFGWPGWVTNLSVFQLYGTPLSSGVDWSGLWALIGIMLLGFAAALMTMQRREVGR
jgi:ABC-2 type transport system permease protein